MAKLACIQMNSGQDIDANLSVAAELLARAAEVGARVALLPENFALLSTRRLLEAGIDERDQNGPIRSFLAEQARSLGMWIIAGSIPVATTSAGVELDDRVRAACMVVNDQGEEVARYDKIHLFDVDVEDDFGSYRESDSIEPGDTVVAVDTPVGKIGLTICYDLRFPELYRALQDQGVQIFTVPAAFTATTGAAHWHTLLRARAIENLCYVAAANQWGEHGRGRESFGHSMIVEPWGTICTEKPSGTDIILVDIDLKALEKARKNMPVKQHRRL